MLHIPVGPTHAKAWLPGMFGQASKDRVVSLAGILSATFRILPRAVAFALTFPKQTLSESLLGLAPDSASKYSHLN
jgi:hypothetical protein